MHSESNSSIGLINYKDYAISIHVPPSEKVYGNFTLQEIKDSHLSQKDKEIILSKFSEKPIKEIEKNYAGERIKTLINLTLFESGMKAEDVDKLTLMVIKDIFTDFSYMTIAEVALAFRKGLRGELGDIFGNSVRTFYLWLRAYNEVKKDSFSELLLLKEEEKKPNEEEKRMSHKKWLNSYIEEFENYKKSKSIEIYDVMNMFYNYCMKNGFCYLSNEIRVELYGKAKEKISRKHSRDKAKNKYEAQEFKGIVNSISDGNMDKKLHHLIVSEAKRLAIPKIFDSLIENNIELKDLIERIESQ